MRYECVCLYIVCIKGLYSCLLYVATKRVISYGMNVHVDEHK